MEENKKLIMIDVKASEYGIEEIKAQQIKAVFVPMLDKMAILETEYNTIIKLDISKETCAKASVLRKKYVKLRTSTAKLHTEQKAFYLAGGRFIDGLKNAQAFASHGIEEKLSEMEKHYENIEKEKILAIKAKREEELRKRGAEFIPSNLDVMDEPMWETYLTGVIAAEKARKEVEEAAKAKVAADRLAQEKLSRKIEAERVAKAKALEKENERLKKERDAADKKAKIEAESRANLEKARLAKEAEEKKAREEAEAKANATRDAELKKEKEKAAKKLAAEKAKAAKKLAEEKKAREEAEAKYKAKKELEAKARAKSIAAQKQKEDAEKNALMAPDKEKLRVLLADIQNIKIPELCTTEAVEITNGVNNLLGKVANYVIEKARKL